MTTLPELKPSPQDPWDRRKAAHLLERAGFGPLSHEIDAAVRDGLDATVRRLLEDSPPPPAYEPPPWVAAATADPSPAELTQMERMRLVLQWNVRNQETKAWWLRRM